MIQLVRSSPKNALNVPPAIIQGEEDRGIAEALGSYLRMGRPEGPSTDDEGDRDSEQAS
jgi:hypothetical protein